MARQSEIVKLQVKDQHGTEQGTPDEVSQGARPEQHWGRLRGQNQNTSNKKQQPMSEGQKQIGVQAWYVCPRVIKKSVRIYGLLHYSLTQLK